jgi:Uma2 family endonuclease
MAVATQTPSATRRAFTADEFHALANAGVFSEDDRVELIEGDIIQMSPIGSAHAECVDRLTQLLVARVGAAVRVRVQNPIRLSDTSEPQPDLAVVRDRSYREGHPTPGDVLLLIEVSDTTLAYDRDIKVPLYARAGVPEVWIIDLAASAILRMTGPQRDGYHLTERFLRGSHIAVAIAPGISIELNVDAILA